MSWHPCGRTLSVGGRRTHCVDVGDGPPVLLLHGFLHSSYTWRETVAGLAARHRVLAPGLPGFGWSDRRPAGASLEALTGWLRALLEALGVGTLRAAVGNSLGGGVLLDMALSAPERLGRLVLVSPLGAPLPLPDLPLRLLGHPALGPLFRATAGNPAFVRRALAWTAYKGRAVDDDVLGGFAHLSRRGSHTAAVETARQLRPAGESLAARLPHLRVPTVLVWGARDGVLPLRYGRRVARGLPHERFEVFEDCGHCPHEERPARFLQLLEENLAPPAAATPQPARSAHVASAS